MTKIFRLNSLRKKLVLVTTLLLMGVFVINGITVITNSIKETRKTLTDQAVAFSQLSTKPMAEAYNLYFNSGYYKFREIMDNTLQLDRNIKRIQFIDVNGNVIFDSKFLGKSNYEKKEHDKVEEGVLEHVLNGNPVYVVSSRNKNEISEIYYPYYTDWGSHSFSIRYFVSYDQIRENILNIVQQAVILMLIFFVLAVGLITGVVNNVILRPISLVNRMTQRISRGKYGERIKVETNDEIEQLASATNKMANTLEQNIKDLKELDKVKDQFIDIAAHNLKVPLNHIKYDIEYLLGEKHTERTGKELLTDININYNKLELLSEDLVNITALKQGSLENNIFMPSNLSFIVKEAVDEIEPLCKIKGIHVHSSIHPDAQILADSKKVKQAILNLLDNAIKFSINKTPISVSLKEKDSSYIIKISDQGVGIAKEELKKLFTKFYRAPSSARYNNEGAGLGLYLAKLIVDVHRGSIWAESTQGKGSDFYISLFKRNVFDKKVAKD